ATITDMLVKAASQGNGTALYELSELYADVDIAQSYKLLTAAVKLRSPDALYRMGMYMISPPATLEINVGPVRNQATGVVMLKMASILGQADARAQLARMYYNGLNQYLAKDVSKAYRHAVIGAAISANPMLMTAQGYMLLTGQGTEKNVEMGLKLIKLAASRKYTYAKCLLGYIYYRGMGVEKKISEAVFHFEDASSYKDPMALIYLALLFDAEKDKSKSTYYLEHAERLLPGKAKAIFHDLQDAQQGWLMTPFPLENI
ncbi:MAG: sel1 repeat family protein, partial [Akkermansia sp.]|nr:sel1 repeat family protein [Akkermansia sp.]